MSTAGVSEQLLCGHPANVPGYVKAVKEKPTPYPQITQMDAVPANGGVVATKGGKVTGIAHGAILRQ